MNENGAWLSGAQKLQGKFESAKIFRTVDQNGVTGLESLRQNFARVAVEKFNIRVWLQFRFRCGRIL